MSWDEYKKLKNEALAVYQSGRLLYVVEGCEDRVTGLTEQMPLRQIRAFDPEAFARLSQCVAKANAARPEALKPRQRVMPRVVEGFTRIVNISITDASNTRKLTSPALVPLERCANLRSDRDRQFKRLCSTLGLPPEEIGVMETPTGHVWASDSIFFHDVSEDSPLWVRESVGKRYEARVVSDTDLVRAPIALLAVQVEPCRPIIVQQSQIRRIRSDKIERVPVRPELPHLLVLSPAMHGK